MTIKQENCGPMLLARICMDAAWASTSLEAGGGSGSPGGDGQGRTSPQAGSRAAGDSWVQPRVQIFGHLRGGEVGPRSSRKVSPQARIKRVHGWGLAPQHHRSGGGLKGPMGRGLVPAEAGQSQ